MDIIRSLAHPLAFAAAQTPLALYHVDLPAPAMGGKIFFIERKGVYVLERGRGVLRSLAVTYTGTGSLAVFDGVPDAHGRFPEAEKYDPYSPEGMRANGRRIYMASPTPIGFWGMDGGFYHGLTVVADGGLRDGAVMTSVVWAAMAAPSSKPVQIVR